ncbi:gamma-glutamylcyclotransferase [Pseudarcicella hirudinis]|uniref:gamma-glutamylcyclotransferase family protein n=1 Tax=Pseudarcicella hirudinis TaxID=1079859 RepID=UPI0035E862B9
MYGTLRKDYGNELHKLIARNSEFIGMADFQGEMFNIGEYPGIVSSENGGSVVKGELYKLSNSVRLIRILDEYEEYYPENEDESIFLRKTINVKIDGKSQEAYGYLYNRPTEGLTRITSGDFLVG